jgi:hypothetical protein
MVLAAHVFLASASPTARAGDPSAADLVTAKAAVKEGRELRKAGDHQGALARFRAAWVLVPTPITGMEVVRECMSLGLLVEARDTAGVVVKLPVGANEGPEHADARKKADEAAGELTKRIPKVTFKLVNAPETGVKVTLDGKDVPLPTLAVARSLDPGSHTLRAGLEDGSSTSMTFSLAEGETKQVVVTLPEAKKAEPNPPPKEPTTPAAEPAKEAPTAPQNADLSPRGGSSLGTIGLVFAGAGVVAAGIGTVVALGAKSDYEAASRDYCGPNGLPGGACTPEGTNARNDARSANTLGWGLAIGGGAFLIGGLTMWALTPTSSPKTTVALTRVGVGPSSFVLEGRF